jgi:hypothetical protein
MQLYLMVTHVTRKCYFVLKAISSHLGLSSLPLCEAAAVVTGTLKRVTALQNPL